MEISIVGTHHCQLGEGPVWDAINQCICWIDIRRGQIHEWNFDNSSLKTINVHEMIGAIAICKDGNFLAGLKNGLAMVNRNNAEVNYFLSPEKNIPANRFNDGKVDPQGRFWIGTMSHAEEEGKGSLYCLLPNKTLETKLTGLTISNGLAWDMKKNTFYFIDTPTMKIMAYDFVPSSGEIKNERVLINFPKDDGFPDGMCIDSDGDLWIAHWGGWKVSCWNTETGKQLDEIKFPVKNITSCCFGGKNMDELFVTSARQGNTPDELMGQPDAGCLFKVSSVGAKAASEILFDQDF